MSSYITVSKDDERFLPLLTGRFSNTHFAHPVRSLHVNQNNETITFKITELESRSLFGALRQWYSVARNIYLIFPILAGLSFLTSVYGLPPWDLVISSVISLQFFLMSLTLYNDYSDYLNGIDRVNEYSSQKPLVLGLIRPYQARQLAGLFIILSAIFAAYCFWQRPATLFFGMAAMVIAGGLVSRKMSRLLRGFSVLTNFILAGPLLIMGYEFLLFQKVSLAAGLLGAIFGLHALKYDFLKQVREMFYNAKAKVWTLPTLFGFEGSKRLLLVFSTLHMGVLVGLVTQLGLKDLWLLVIVSLYFETYLNNLVVKAPSFLSSNITQALSLQKLYFAIESSLITVIFLGPQWLLKF